MKLPVLTLIALVSALAQQSGPAPTDPVKKPEAVPLEVEAEYFQADAIVAHMTPSWQDATKRLSEAAQAIQKVCGTRSIIVPGAPLPAGGTNDTRHIVCADAAAKK